MRKIGVALCSRNETENEEGDGERMNSVASIYSC